MNLRQVRKKTKSVSNVKKITRSMQLVSAIKMKKSQQAAVEAGPYQMHLESMIKKIIGYEGRLTLDTSKPDGAPYKIMNVDKMKEVMDWMPETKFKDGVKTTIDWYYKNIINIFI